MKINARVFADRFTRIYDPSVGEDKDWYINDHTVVRGEDGWHLFGITHEEPAMPLEETLCAHAFTADILNTPFVKMPYPMQAEKEKDELHFWAPHIIRNDGLYYMYYCAGSLESHERYRIHLSVSKDLRTWERCAENPMLIDGFDARDPMVIRVGDKWVMYYTCTGTPAGGNHCVACVTSTDLIHWGDKQIVFTSGISGTYGGPCESPFVEKVGELYFLFVGPWGGYGNGYCDTAVFVSDDPFSFGGEPVGRIPAHAAEVLSVNGAYYITHCGWGQGGVYLAPLHFEF